MGYAKNQRQNQADERASRRAKRTKRIPLGWDVVNPDFLGLFVHLMVRGNRAVLFGSSGDGDVLSLNVYDDGEKERFYIRLAKNAYDDLIECMDEYSESAADTLSDFLARQKESDTTPSTKSAEKTSDGV